MNLKDFIIGQSVYVTNEPAKCFVIEDFDFIDPEQAYVNGTWYLLDELSLVKNEKTEVKSKTQVMKDWAENNGVEVLDGKSSLNDDISFFDESLPINYPVTQVPSKAEMNDWEIEKSKLLQATSDKIKLILDADNGEYDLDDYWNDNRPDYDMY